MVTESQLSMEDQMAEAVQNLQPPAPARAFRVLHGGRLLGFLGSVPGSFESATGAAEPGPPACCYRSVTSETESAILELLHATTDFDALIELLGRAGLTLEETNADGLFSPNPIIYKGIVPSSIEEDS